MMCYEMEGKMSSYIFEVIEHEEKYPAKVFVTSIDVRFIFLYNLRQMVSCNGGNKMSRTSINFDLVISTIQLLYP